MVEVLYAVREREIFGKGRALVVLSSITRTAEGYEYVPQNLNNDSTPRRPVKEKTKTLPAIAKRRIISEKRPDLKKLLNRLGLEVYDEWEILKRTKGKLPSDDIVYLSAMEIENIANSNGFIVVGDLGRWHAVTKEVAASMELF